MQATNHERINVLLVEDNPADVRLVTEFLHDASHDRFNLLTASTLAQGLSLLAKSSVDVILLDLGLPDCQGLDTFHAIHRHASGLPIIILTISEDEALGQQMLQEGAQRFLSKDALTLGQPYAGVFTRMIRFAIEQKRAEAALAESEQHFQTLFNSSAIAQVYYDATGYPIRANSAALTLFGIADVNALQHMTIFSSPRMSDDDKARLRAGEPVEYEQEYDFDAIKASGGFETTNSGTRDVHVFFTPLRNMQTGSIDGYLGQITDVTERTRAERLLQAAHANVQALNEELHTANEELEQRVQERTEELQATNERLLNEIGERTSAEQKAEARAHRTAILDMIIHVLNEAPDLLTLYDRALATTIDRLGFDRGMVATETASGHLSVQYAYHLPPEFIQASNHLNVDEYSYARTIYREGKLVLVEEAPPETLGAKTGSHGAAAGIPFYSEGKIVGHIALYSDRSQSFTAEDRQLFTAIGEEFGTAMARLRAKEQVQEYARRQEILNRIIAEGNRASDLQAALRAILDAAMGLVNFTDGAIFLLNETEGVAEQRYARGFNDEVLERGRRIPLTTSFYAEIYEGKPQFFNDYPQEGTPQFAELLPDIRILALIPLVAKRRAIGHYVLASARSTPFTDEERGLLTAIGQQAGTVIGRLQAEERIREHSERLEDLVQERTAQLAQSEEEFRTLFDKSAIAQIRYDAEGLPLRMNNAGAELFGVRDINDIRYRNMFSSIQAPEEDMARLRKGHSLHCEQVYDFRAIREADLYPTTRSDVRHFDLYVLPLMSATGTFAEGYLAQIVDITELKEAEVALKEAERLAGIGQTATMIGHDLRNPLQALQFSLELEHKYCESISADIPEDPRVVKAGRLLASMEQQIKYMDKIVADLQDYARPLHIEPEVVHMAAFIIDTLGLLTVPEPVSVNVDIPGSLTAAIDPHLMQRVFANLILNAVQAMPHGGELTVNAAAEDHSIAIYIHDTGEGVPENMKETLFSPLTTGKAKGTGLGLAVVKRIIEAHNGTITFTSEEGKGTTFTVTLPQTAE